jgi:hypothetical protein
MNKKNIQAEPGYMYLDGDMELGFFNNWVTKNWLNGLLREFGLVPIEPAGRGHPALGDYQEKCGNETQ